MPRKTRRTPNMVNPLAPTKINWWKIKDQWMDTSVSCSIKCQVSLLHWRCRLCNGEHTVDSFSQSRLLSPPILCVCRFERAFQRQQKKREHHLSHKILTYHCEFPSRYIPSRVLYNFGPIALFEAGNINKTTLECYLPIQHCIWKIMDYFGRSRQYLVGNKFINQMISIAWAKAIKILNIPSRPVNSVLNYQTIICWKV